MPFVCVKLLKCKGNKKSDGSVVPLTVGELYRCLESNAPLESDFYIVCDNKGNVKAYDSGYFEIEDTLDRTNLGWTLQCMDCLKSYTLDELVSTKEKRCDCGQNLSL